MVKYFFLERQGSKLMHEEHVKTLQDSAISLFIVKNWLKRFKSGEFSCSDEEWHGRLLISLGPVLQRFLKKFRCTSARVMAGQGSVDRTTIKSILDRELRLRKFTRRWGPHIQSAEQKLRRVMKSESLLTLLANLAEKNFQRIITGDESWFAHLIENDALCLRSRVRMNFVVVGLANFWQAPQIFDWTLIARNFCWTIGRWTNTGAKRIFLVLSSLDGRYSRVWSSRAKY
jgi:hypothetical protein